tara:strand:+ start:118 stop:987 length:870 start_codon:yes stop_codon:yes gene_type:complete
MNQIYLVCTRSAISASALTYIINQSPEFYNVVHNNLWITETGSEFNDAIVIEDWWNIPTGYEKSTYTHDVRNNEHMELNTLRSLSDDWAKLETNKNLALFTHATNTADIIKWRNEHNLPIIVITTTMGVQSYKYVDLFLKREYSDEMNKFVSLFDTWKYIYDQYSSMDIEWAKHADVVLAMNDWLGDPNITYSKLGIEKNHNIKSWVNEYLVLNGYEEWNIRWHELPNKLKTLGYVYAEYESLFHTTPGKKLFALSILETVKYNDDTITDVQQVIDKTEKIIRNQLTFA